VVGGSEAVCRAPDRRSAVERIVSQRNIYVLPVVYRNNLKGRPTPINDREARAFAHAFDDIGK